MSGPQLPWSTVLDVSGPPIEAEASTFFDLADFFTTLKEDTQLVADAFTGIVNDANADFQGESAEAFATMVGDLGSTLALVPTTAEEASGFLRSHGTELDALRIEASAALGRANTRYGEVQRAKTNLELAEAGRNRLQDQVDNFDQTVCGDDSHRVQAQLDLDTASTGVRGAESNLSDAEGELARSKTEYDGLVDDYRELDNRTGTDLDNIGLGDLSDPSWWEQAWNGISGFVVDVLSDIVMGAFEMVAGLITGDWERMLWGMSDFLSGVLTVVTIVALFTPIGPALILALAATKLVVDLVLFTTDSTNPRTGEQITKTGLAFTALTVAASGAAQWQSVNAASSASTSAASTAAPAGQGAIPSLFRAPAGAPQGATGQISTVARGVRDGTNVAATQFVTAPSVTTAYSQAGSTVVNTAATLAPDAVQVASTFQTVGSTVYDVYGHATVSPLADEVATVSSVAPAIAPPISGQITDLDGSGAVQSQTPAGYGVVVLVPAGEDS